jgi:hypothetical protein
VRKRLTCAGIGAALSRDAAGGDEVLDDAEDALLLMSDGGWGTDAGK